MIYRHGEDLQELPQPRHPFAPVEEPAPNTPVTKAGLSIRFDWKRPGASVITQRILSDAQSGAIILSHDIRQQTIDALPATFDALLAKEYKFVTVSQLIAMNHPKPPSPTATVSRTPQQ